MPYKQTLQPLQRYAETSGGAVVDADNGFPQDAARATLLTPAELAAWLRVDRAYVYEHASELGAMRLGDGPRARLRFDLEVVRQAISCSVGRRSDVVDRAPEVVSRPRRRRRAGTSVDLLPIRGSAETVGGTR